MDDAPPPPLRSPFEALPRYVATSVLSYAASGDWLNFRVASRASFGIVHGGAGDPSAGDEESESLWRLALLRDYGFGQADDGSLLRRSIRMDPRADAFLSADDVFDAPNAFASWKHWRRIDVSLHRNRTSTQRACIPASERVVGPYFLRAASLWRKIEHWCDDEGRSGTLGREIKSSLSPGRPLDPNSHDHVPNPKTSALKAVYAFHSGQIDPMMQAPSVRPQRFNPFTGLFGGFQAYDIVSNSRWMEPEFGGFGGPDDYEGQQPYLVVTQGEMKATVLFLASGQVYFLSDGRMSQKLLATPLADDESSEDSILRWFEEHADRVHRGLYSVGNIVANVPGRPRGQTIPSLLRYPTRADAVNCSCAVTRGVEVVASAVYVPEMGMFVYSIRMRLLAPEDGDGYAPPAERGFDSCQLASRHWRIGKSPPDSSEPRIQEVRGEGVIGMYPLLYEGRYTNVQQDDRGRLCEAEQGTGYFSYQSCSEADMPGFFEGSLQFIPGSLTQPSGDIFDVRVARFPLKFDQFLY